MFQSNGGLPTLQIDNAAISKNEANKYLVTVNYDGNSILYNLTLFV